MSDEDMPELPEVPALENLLAAYKEETARSPSQVESALNTVTAHVGSGAGAGAAGLSTGAKVGIAGALAGVIGVVAFAVSSPEPPPARRPAPSIAVTDEPARPPPPREDLEVETVPATAEPIEPPPVETAQPEPTPRPRSRRKARPPAPKPQPKPASTLAEELERLQQARAALRAGNPARARAMVGAHRIDFPDSTLAPERDATEIAALCAEKRVAAARAKADAFAKAYPGSSRDLLADCDD